MAIIEMKVPSPGESINEVQISQWLKKDGDYVEKDEEICEIDSDKATLTLNAEASGIIKLIAKQGDTIAVGSIVCSIDTSAAPVITKKEVLEKEKIVPQPSSVSQEPSSTNTINGTPVIEKAFPEKATYAKGIPSVAAEKIIREKGINASQITGTGKSGRITKADVLEPQKAETSFSSSGKNRNERREKMSLLRKRVAERLVAVKQETAMLTTFNEVDMSAIMDIRKQYKELFKEKFGVGLGFMSFFTKAVCEALKNSPIVNSKIDGTEIVYHDYCDIGIAVSAPKGLMVPVIRNAETLTMAQIESSVLELATKARESKLSIEEMTGGTFTITNGGVFGSMLSTPIINPPQCAILGMHNIVERAVVINGKIEIRPIMYVALSYDHRIFAGSSNICFTYTKKPTDSLPSMMR